jgi:hypothetical protein
MPFSENGFLGHEAMQSSELFRQQHAEYFNHFKEVNKVSHRFVGEGILDTTNGRQLFIGGLFLRSLTEFQAMVILTERGITSEMKTLLRSILELRFQIQAIAKDDIAAKRLIFQGEKKVRERLEALKAETWLDKKNPHRADVENRFKAQDAEVKRLEADILTERPELADKKGRLPKLGLEDLAKIAIMTREYKIVYSSLCEAAHSSAKYLEEMGSFDENGNFIGFMYPERDPALLTFCLGGTGLHLDNLETTAAILKMVPPSELELLRNRNAELKNQGDRTHDGQPSAKTTS